MRDCRRGSELRLAIGRIGDSSPGGAWMLSPSPPTCDSPDCLICQSQGLAVGGFGGSSAKLAWFSSFLICAVASSTLRKSVTEPGVPKKLPELELRKLVGRAGGEVGVGSCAIEPRDRDDRSSRNETSSFMRIKMSYILGAAFRDAVCNSPNFSTLKASGSI